MANEVPDYLKEYLKNVSNPYQRSLIGNYFSKQREQEAFPTGEELFPEEQPEQVTEGAGEAAPQEASLLDIGMGAAFKPMYAGWAGAPFRMASEKLLNKGIAKGVAKGLGKVGSRFIPGVGWGLAAADLVDYFGYPIYDHIPGGDYLTWRNTEEQGEE